MDISGNNDFDTRVWLGYSCIYDLFLVSALQFHSLVRIFIRGGIGDS